MDGKEYDLCIKHQYRNNIMNEQNQEKTYNLRISSKNKYNPITKYDSTLTANGFTYNERKAAYSSFYERNDATWEEVNTWGLWARKYNLEMHVVEMKYTSNTINQYSLQNTAVFTVVANYYIRTSQWITFTQSTN